MSQQLLYLAVGMLSMNNILLRLFSGHGV